MESGLVIRATGIGTTPLDTAITRTDTIDHTDTMVMALRITVTTMGTMAIELTVIIGTITIIATNLK